MRREKNPVTWLQEYHTKLLKRGVEEGVFPAAASGVFAGSGKERTEIISFYGHAALYPEKRKLEINSFFDLASLTKPLATAMAVLSLMAEKRIALDEPLSSLLNRKISDEKNQITTENLLNHSSGLPAHREYFKILKDIPQKDRDEKIEDLILQEKPAYSPGKTSIYSDLGYILLGRIIEKKSGSNLACYITEKVLKPLNLADNIFYNPLQKSSRHFKKTDFVATEKCPWRRKILCGEVHDDNCYSLGGVAGHSGLFGNISGVTAYVSDILDLWQGRLKHPNIRKEDLVFFLTRPEKSSDGSWVLGFDTPADHGSSSGSHFSPRSIGHLGFTGTSFWLDPEKRAGIILLTNRVHPSRDNTKIKKFRPFFHDRVMEKLFPQSR